MTKSGAYPTVYLASMAVIGGAKSLDSIQATVIRGMMPMLKVSAKTLLVSCVSDQSSQILWISSPTATLVAQYFLPTEVIVSCLCSSSSPLTDSAIALGAFLQYCLPHDWGKPVPLYSRSFSTHINI
jgi:hypothetical protein